jgi:two-component system CheB/CheR fusion protein
VLDLDLQVRVWSDRAQELWGLRAEEVRLKHFLDLDIGLPVAQLSDPIRACVTSDRGYAEVVLPAINRRGRAIQCYCTLSHLTQEGGDRGIILLMDERDVQPIGLSAGELHEPER